MKFTFGLRIFFKQCVELCTRICASSKGHDLLQLSGPSVFPSVGLYQLQT